MSAPSLTVRPAFADDARLLFDWVNRPDSLAGKLKTDGPILWEAHLAWFRRRLADPGTLILIGLRGPDRRPAGQVRLQRCHEASARAGPVTGRLGALEPGIYEVDIFVDPAHRGTGVARRLLALAAAQAGQRWGDVILRALVRPENVRSSTLFATAGYEQGDPKADPLVFEYAVRVPCDPSPGGTMMPDSEIDRRSFDRSMALFERVSKTIPLATQTFSKSHMNCVFGAAPLFLEYGDGSRVWDVDGNDYIDYVLGLLPVVLGYRDPDVDAAIRNQLERGISFSLATELEIELAEKLVRLIPSAEMVRFGKNGTDATTAAIRLARAATGRDKVAVAGYHGWEDWYIASTTRNLGVPEAVQALTVSFPFSDPDALAALLEREPTAFAAVILEPAGVTEPPPGGLERIRALCDRYGVVLVYDEIVTGFRIALGGGQARYGVMPDLSCFGKAMANGMPLSAIVGRADLMRRMDDIFFSGTFGGETLSLAAALVTLGKLERLDGCRRLHTLGTRLAAGAREAVTRHGLGDAITVAGTAWWPRLRIQSWQDRVPPLIVSSLLRQELVQQGLLMGAAFNLCLAHDDPAVEAETLSALDAALAATAAALDSPEPAELVRGRPIQPIFQVRKS